MPSPTRCSERGAILIQVGIAILALTAFSMFVVDYGILWVSRAQAQNAADAGALAGVIALSFDNFDDRTNTGPAKMAARSFALANSVFGEAPDVNIETDVQFVLCPGDAAPPSLSRTPCMRVDVYRNQARGNPLPVWFGSLVGLEDQGVWATATAWAKSANASRCLMPWALADKWFESDGGGFHPAAEFDPADGDVYAPPGAETTGTSFSLTANLGAELGLRSGFPDGVVNPGRFQPVDLNDGDYTSNISECADVVWEIGDELPRLNGDMVDATGEGTTDLIDLDPGADWDPVGHRVINSCVETGTCVDAEGNPAHYSQSPRIVSVPVFDLGHYMATGGPGAGTVRIVNILGFFVDRVEGLENTVVGYLAPTTGGLAEGGGEISEEAAFAKAIQLVR